MFTVMSALLLKTATQTKLLLMLFSKNKNFFCKSNKD